MSCPFLLAEMFEASKYMWTYTGRRKIRSRSLGVPPAAEGEAWSTPASRKWTADKLYSTTAGQETNVYALPLMHRHRFACDLPLILHAAFACCCVVLVVFTVQYIELFEAEEAGKPAKKDAPPPPGVWIGGAVDTSGKLGR